LERAKWWQDKRGAGGGYRLGAGENPGFDQKKRQSLGIIKKAIQNATHFDLPGPPGGDRDQIQGGEELN